MMGKKTDEGYVQMKSCGRLCEGRQMMRKRQYDDEGKGMIRRRRRKIVRKGIE